MEKFVKDFKHHSGVHCESTALRDVFAYYGIEFSEPMVFGLGGGGDKTLPKKTPKW
jgi:hypothetical protein